MASKSILKMSAINNFLGPYASKALNCGENALESGHLSNFTYDGELSPIKAKMLASQRNVVYTVSIEFSRTEILRAEYECARGLVSCHHMAAVMSHAHKTLSVTDSSCPWAAKSQKRQKSCGDSMTELVPSENFNVFKSPLNVEILKEKILDEVKEFENGEAAHMAWLLSSEPMVTEEVQGVNLKHPIDVILSREFEVATNKLDFIIENLCVNEEIIGEIALSTIGQNRSPTWMSVRELRLTVSRFGSVINVYSKKKNPGVPSQSLLSSLYETPDLGRVKATQWGREHEDVALQQFRREYNKEVWQTGIWLHECGAI